MLVLMIPKQGELSFVQIVLNVCMLPLCLIINLAVRSAKCSIVSRGKGENTAGGTFPRGSDNTPYIGERTQPNPVAVLVLPAIVQGLIYSAFENFTTQTIMACQGLIVTISLLILQSHFVLPGPTTSHQLVIFIRPADCRMNYLLV